MSKLRVKTSGPSFLQVVRKLRRQHEKNLEGASKDLMRAWPRLVGRQARDSPPAPSDTLIAESANGGRTVSLGWRDFDGGAAASRARFESVEVEIPPLVERIANRRFSGDRRKGGG